MRRVLPLLCVLLLGAGDPKPPVNYGPPGEDNLKGPDAAEHAYQVIAIGSFDIEKPHRPLKGEVALGKKLFFDPRLSADGKMSCAVCHRPEKAWTDGKPRAIGHDGKPLQRNTPSLFAGRRNIRRKFFWDGRAEYLDDAVRTAMQSRLEMNVSSADFDKTLRALPGYEQAFDAVYGQGGLSLAHTAKAISEFVYDAADPGLGRFDRWSRDPSALNAAEQRGMVVFAGKGKCATCHLGAYFSDDYYHNTGLKRDPALDDPGRYAVENKPSFWRAFKTPPLRNVAQTAPYMHDGRLPTLEAVIEHYDKGGDVPRESDPDNEIYSLHLSTGEKADLLAFLRALTGEKQGAERR